MKPWKKYPVLIAIITMLSIVSLNIPGLFQLMALNDGSIQMNENFQFIEPSLMQHSMNEDSRAPVIVLFDQGRFAEDSRQFLELYGNDGFELKRKFSLIPAISGYIAPEKIPTLVGSSIGFRMYENKIVALPSDFKSQFLDDFSIKPSNAPGWWKEAVGANDSSLSGLTGAGVKVGILDTGIGYESGSTHVFHEDLSGKVVESVNFANGTSSSDIYDGFGHGTHVAGIVAGSGAASGGLYSGIAPNVDLYNVKVLNSSGGGYEDDIILGMEWSVNESLDVINLSLGFNSPDPLYPTSLAAKATAMNGVVVVASAGNSGPRYYTGGSPGSAEGVITVGATDSSNNVTHFSSRGPNLGRMFDPDVVAPGEDIISLLGHNSFMDMFLTYYGLVIEGNQGDGSHYVSSSGTSMSAPVVTAAVALIKENFSAYDLSPYLVTMALMETTTDLGYDACTQGAGLINISAAIAFLEAQKTLNNLTSIVKAFPKTLPYAPFDLINFPGDFQEFNVKFLYAGSQNISLEVVGLPSGITIGLPSGNISLVNSSGEILVPVTIQTSFNATPGDYNISILVKNGTNATMDTINVSFTLKTPQLKVYLDTYHSLEDQFLYFDEYYRLPENYYLLARNLSGRNVSITSSMDYLTAAYNSSSSKTHLELPLLKKFDVVILPPARIAYLEEEIDALKRYREEGGHLVILGSRYQEFSHDAANTLVTALGIDAGFTDTNHEDFTDNGWEFVIRPTNVTGVNSSHFLSSNVSWLSWDSGVLLENNGSTPVVASHGLDPLIMMENATGGNGSVFLSGSDSLIVIDPWDEDEANNLAFINNLLDYYIGGNDIKVFFHFPNTTYTESSSLSVFFQIMNVTSFQSLNTSEVVGLSCKINNATSISLAMIDGEWMGNNSVDISALANSSTPHVIDLNFSINSVDYHYSLAFFKYSDDAIDLNASIADNTLYRNENLSIGFNDTMINTTVQVTGLPGNPFSDKGIFTSVQNVSNSLNFSMVLSNTMPAGTYFVNFMEYYPDGNDPWALEQRTQFTVHNKKPIFDNSSSTFEGNRFDEIDMGDNKVRVLTVAIEKDLSLKVHAIADETAEQDMDAFVIFYPTFILNNVVGLIPYGGNLIMEQLVYDSSSQGFKGSISIPQGATFTVDGEEKYRSFMTSGDYSGALLVVLRDGDGTYELFVILLTIIGGFPNLTWLLPTISIAAGILLLLLVLRHRRRGLRGSIRETRKIPVASVIKMETETETETEETKTLKYCPYCGKPLEGGEHYCGAFKKRISF